MTSRLVDYDELELIMRGVWDKENINTKHGFKKLRQAIKKKLYPNYGCEFHCWYIGDSVCDFVIYHPTDNDKLQGCPNHGSD